MDTNTRFNIGNLLTGIVAMLVGMNSLSDNGILEDSHPMLEFILLTVAIASLLNTTTARLNFANQAGETNTPLARTHRPAGPTLRTTSIHANAHA
jgi:hypothetical protein